MVEEVRGIDSLAQEFEELVYKHFSSSESERYKCCVLIGRLIFPRPSVYRVITAMGITKPLASEEDKQLVRQQLMKSLFSDYYKYGISPAITSEEEKVGRFRPSTRITLSLERLSVTIQASERIPILEGKSFRLGEIIKDGSFTPIDIRVFEEVSIERARNFAKDYENMFNKDVKLIREY